MSPNEGGEDVWKVLLILAFGADIDALGADDFEARQAAEARLSRWADVAYPLLEYPFQDVERRRRARRVLALAVPVSHAPLSLLSGRPMTEWCLPGDLTGCIGPKPYGEGRFLGWLHPDPRAPLAPLIRLYGERVRTQYTWRDWMICADDREATRLLCRDLLRAGVPAPCVRALADLLRAREVALDQPAVMERIP